MYLPQLALVNHNSTTILNVLMGSNVNLLILSKVICPLMDITCLPQLDYKVGWKKLKEVFGMAGVVVRADILEDKDGKSRGMGTVTFDIPIEAVQAVCILE